MLQYLIILLDDNAPSFCYYPDRTSRRLMPLDRPGDHAGIPAAGGICGSP